LGEYADAIPLTANKRFFFGATPSLNLPFNCIGIGVAIEIFRPNQLHRAARERVPLKATKLMLGNTFRQVVASCVADVIGPVRALQYVNERPP
jgi:hypothetical protein